MDSFPGLARSAALQRVADFSLWLSVLKPRHSVEARLALEAWRAPGMLLLETQPLGSEDRAVHPVMSLKAG